MKSNLADTNLNRSPRHVRAVDVPLRLEQRFDDIFWPTGHKFIPWSYFGVKLLTAVQVVISDWQIIIISSASIDDNLPANRDYHRVVLRVSVQAFLLEGVKNHSPCVKSLQTLSAYNNIKSIINVSRGWEWCAQITFGHFSVTDTNSNYSK